MTEKKLTVDNFPNEYEVAVVVFTTARGVDARDAGSRVERAIWQKLEMDQPKASLPMPHPGYDVDGAVIKLHSVREVGIAAANGYLWVRPTDTPRNMGDWAESNER